MANTETTPQTLEEVIEQARRENLPMKAIKSLLFHAGLPKDGAALQEIREALGREKGPAGPTAEEVAAQKAEAERIAAERREQQDRDQEAREAADRKRREDAIAQVAAAKAAIADGAVIWCDAAENTVTRVVNSYGRKAKFDNGGYRVGLLVETEAGDFPARHYNTKCPDQFAGECYAVLKAVELAKDCGLNRCTIRNDRIGGFEAVSSKKVKKGYIGAKYLYVASKIAEEHGIAVTFDGCAGDENRADRISRTEAN